MGDFMEMRESFRGPFVEMARQRQKRIAELVGGQGDDAAELRSAASELHCLSGEASMLDFARVADLARAAEVAARKADRGQLRDLVLDLHSAIEAVAKEGAS
jgi:HPt (histidine-containing phosphotransfer) domain-containing protein